MGRLPQPFVFRSLPRRRRRSAHAVHVCSLAVYGVFVFVGSFSKS